LNDSPLGCWGMLGIRYRSAFLPWFLAVYEVYQLSG
jgi:hypothetical protein